MSGMRQDDTGRLAAKHRLILELGKKLRNKFGGDQEQENNPSNNDDAESLRFCLANTGIMLPQLVCYTCSTTHRADHHFLMCIYSHVISQQYIAQLCIVLQ